MGHWLKLGFGVGHEFVFRVVHGLGSRVGPGLGFGFRVGHGGYRVWVGHGLEFGVGHGVRD